jgi:hypothetical protein
MLIPDERDAGRVTLRHLKARHTEPRDIALTFDRRCQRFEPVADPHAWKPDEHRGKLQAALAMAWDRTEPADDGRDEF